jgi:hypothetical protein
MQTFVPFPDFHYSCHVLDTKRHGKQRLEAKQILMCLLGTGSTGWRNHPAVRMWQGHEQSLSNYYRATCITWEQKGFTNTMFIPPLIENARPCPWLGDPDLHISHQANLVSKFPEYYKHMFPRVDATLPYLWPSQTIAYRFVCPPSPEPLREPETLPYDIHLLTPKQPTQLAS